jgi:hypothetical protein
VNSEVGDMTVKVRLRRQTNHRPTRYSRGPYWLDLQAVVCMSHITVWASASLVRRLVGFCLSTLRESRR